MVGLTGLDPIERAVKEIAAGRAVIVVDDEDRENEGDLIFAAELATTELIAERSFWIGCYPGLDRPALEHVAEAFAAFRSRGAVARAA